ncbi:hypothetical protein D915_003091 [Fasciola hepatica]|uniref:Uncharacterized protein n=1 Tax=Fasciola hepatica TaxID=6192 RepID=A0A4E0RJE3_FASHE|nr:hypothetical protein D915_003091 [Fasciola hepatica]
MAATEWTCDIDVSSPVLTPPSRLSTERMVFSTSTDHNALPVNTSDIEPATKRSRLTLTDEFTRANGVSESYQKPVSDSAAARLGLSDRFKISFCARFKSALREKLESYFSRLEKAEESANTIQKELTELSGRMDAIDTSSQELKKFVTERVSCSLIQTKLPSVRCRIMNESVIFACHSDVYSFALYHFRVGYIEKYQ